MAGPRIVVASGKGGTGKTTVATALAVTLSKSLAETQFLDCDVEEPDAALFLKPEIEGSTMLTIDSPTIDPAKCTACGDCQEACQYNAVRVVSGKAEVYDGLCHSCGGCILACPVGAVSEIKKRIGVIERGRRESIVFYRGVLDVGRHLTAPIIRGLRNVARSDIPTIMDSAPGTTAHVLATIKDCDYCLLVTEPTPFGLHDLKLMLRAIEEVRVPAGIIINKDTAWSSNIEAYAADTGIPILMRIPFRREIAVLCSRGMPLTEADPSWDDTFWNLYEGIERSA